MDNSGRYTGVRRGHLSSLLSLTPERSVCHRLLPTFALLPLHLTFRYAAAAAANADIAAICCRCRCHYYAMLRLFSFAAYCQLFFFFRYAAARLRWRHCHAEAGYTTWSPYFLSAAMISPCCFARCVFADIFAMPCRSRLRHFFATIL